MNCKQRLYRKELNIESEPYLTFASHESEVRFTYLLLLIIFTQFLSACIARTDTPNQSDVALYIAKAEKVIKQSNSRFMDTTLHFSLTAHRPGWIVHSRGTVFINRKGVLRLELRSPMGITTHFLQIKENRYQYRDSQSQRQGDINEHIPELIESIGADITAADVRLFFTGSLILQFNEHRCQYYYDPRREMLIIAQPRGELSGKVLSLFQPEMEHIVEQRVFRQVVDKKAQFVCQYTYDELLNHCSYIPRKTVVLIGDLRITLTIKVLKCHEKKDVYLKKSSR